MALRQGHDSPSASVGRFRGSVEQTAVKKTLSVISKVATRHDHRQSSHLSRSYDVVGNFIKKALWSLMPFQVTFVMFSIIFRMNIGC